MLSIKFLIHTYYKTICTVVKTHRFFRLGLFKVIRKISTSNKLALLRPHATTYLQQPGTGYRILGT